MKYHIVTLGCQMNERDSETIAGILCEMGMTAADTKESADLILYNTCCVRENAENRALGNVIWLKELKAKKPDLIICVAGCMAQEEGMGERMFKAYPFIDLILGTHNLYRLEELLRPVIKERRRVLEIIDEDGRVREGLPVKRSVSFAAYITVIYGCDNYCSYCIVPYVRGRERSREMSKILDEAARLIDSGVVEITLLGQNVNSYGGGGAAFAELLYRLDKLGAPRVRFMTSHPKDVSGELIACYGELKSLCPHLHLPVQSGSDRVLAAMNRGYTSEQYMETVNKLRGTRPDIGLTGDIIVGFPGETELDFIDTMSLIERVRFDSAFTFIYSPRAGTAAAAMPDHTPREEKSRRIEALISAQQKITGEVLNSLAGRLETVLVEGVSARDKGSVCGKTGRAIMVNFPGGSELIGHLVDVSIVSSGKNTLRGVKIGAYQ